MITELLALKCLQASAFAFGPGPNFPKLPLGISKSDFKASGV